MWKRPITVSIFYICKRHISISIIGNLFHLFVYLIFLQFFRTGSLPRGGVLEPQEFFSNHPRVSQQTENRVKKLTKFFGDEPPLLRLYLKNLGYEKYASIFEEAKIGMLELPYLSEERLEKLGVPLGPRIRILQESKMPYSLEGQNYNVYIL